MPDNRVRDFALSVSAGALVVLTTMFGMKQCSCDDNKKTECEKKTPKIEVVNDNNVEVDGGAKVKNNTRIVVGDDAIVVKNQGGRDTVVVVVKPQPQSKPKPQPAPAPAPQPQPEPAPAPAPQPAPQPEPQQSNVSVAWGCVCTLSNGLCR